MNDCETMLKKKQLIILEATDLRAVMNSTFLL